MRVYLAGPMSHHRLYNFPAFDAAKHRLSFKGYTVVSPADIDRNHGFDPVNLSDDHDWNTLPDGFDYEAVMERDLVALATCEAIVMLPGWEASKGANRELARANDLGLRVFVYDETEPGLLREEAAVVHETQEMGRLCEEAVSEGILDEAKRLTTGDRNESYGPPDEDLSRAGRMWGPILGLGDVPAWKVALCMVALKISREVNSPKRDNAVDMAGYASLLERIYERVPR